MKTCNIAHQKKDVIIKNKTTPTTSTTFPKMFSKHLDEKYFDNIIEMFSWKKFILKYFKNISQRFGNVTQTIQQMFVNHLSHLWKLLWIRLVFAGWITFTERFKNTRKTISLNMVLATLLKHLPKLIVNI